MENVHCRVVHLGHIDWDDRLFAIPACMPATHLEESLTRVGILSPAWVWFRGHNRYSVVDGFKRLEWARDAGISTVRCLVFPSDADQTRLMFMRLEGKLFGPPLNVAEKAQVIARLSRWLPLKRSAKDYFSHFNVASRSEVLQAWERLANAGERLLMAAASGEVFERTALELAQWDGEARERALIVLQDLRCSASIQMEILERVTEIGKREAKSRLHVLNDAELNQILQDSRSNHRQKTQAVRELLTQLRFPRLKEREERFSRQMGEAGLPGNTRLIPPPSFEGGRWQLQLSFSTPAELQELVEVARGFARSKLIAEMMESKPQGS